MPEQETFEARAERINKLADTAREAPLLSMKSAVLAVIDEIIPFLIDLGKAEDAKS